MLSLISHGRPCLFPTCLSQLCPGNYLVFCLTLSLPGFVCLISRSVDYCELNHLTLEIILWIISFLDRLFAAILFPETLNKLIKFYLSTTPLLSVCCIWIQFWSWQFNPLNCFGILCWSCFCEWASFRCLGTDLRVETRKIARVCWRLSLIVVSGSSFPVSIAV